MKLRLQILCTAMAIVTLPHIASAQAAQDGAGQEQPGEARSTPPPPGEGLLGDNVIRSKEDDGPWHINGRLGFDTRFLTETDLDPATTDDEVASIAPEARIDILYTPDDDIEFLASVEAGVDFNRSDGAWDTRERLEVRELYVLVDDFLAKDFQLQVGRQDVEDGREWLYDAKLDGVRVAYDHKAWRIEAMVGREELLQADLLHSNPGRRKVDVYLFHAEYEAGEDWDIAAYAVKQDDRLPTNVSPTTIGIQSEGRIGNFGHWLELARQTGTSGARRLKAWAIDAGVIAYLPGPARPALFAGYARGSGGGDANVDRDFRQTRLQDNEDRITGLGNVRYYGEALDPDLSNLQVFTLGAGIRPTNATSIELVGHRYSQVVANDGDLRGSPISAELTGDDRSIGTEVDLVASARLSPRMALEAKLGWFDPGDGYGPDRKDAFYGKLRLLFRF